MNTSSDNIHVGHMQMLLVNKNKYRAEWWNGGKGFFELVLIDEFGKDYGLQRFSRSEIYQGIEKGIIKKMISE